MKQAKVMIAIRLETQDYIALRKLSEVLDTAYSNIVREALSEYLNKEEMINKIQEFDKLDD